MREKHNNTFFVEIENASHNIFIENIDQFNGEMRNALKHKQKRVL